MKAAENEVALGLRRFVFAFAARTGAATYREWKERGLSKLDATVASQFEAAFEDALSNARHIHFVLDGIDNFAIAVRSGCDRGLAAGNFTNWELFRVLSRASRDAAFARKLTFYEGKAILTLEEVTARVKAG